VGQLAATAGRHARRARRRLVEGSVSGGCVEDDIVGRVAHDGMTATECSVVTYGVSADEARRFGLPCGGTIQLVLEPLTLRQAFASSGGDRRRQLVARRLELATGKATLAGARERRACVRRQGADDHPRPRYRMLVIGASQLSKYLAQMALGLDYQVTSAIRASSTRRRGMSPACRSSRRCRTTPCWR
jgi:xanthine dehydrogenase accessory factor